MKKIIKLLSCIVLGFGFILVVSSCTPKEPILVDPPEQVIPNGTFTIEFPPME